MMTCAMATTPASLEQDRAGQQLEQGRLGALDQFAEPDGPGDPAQVDDDAAVLPEVRAEADAADVRQAPADIDRRHAQAVAQDRVVQPVRAGAVQPADQQRGGRGHQRAAEGGQAGESQSACWRSGGFRRRPGTAGGPGRPRASAGRCVASGRSYQAARCGAITKSIAARANMAMTSKARHRPVARSIGGRSLLAAALAGEHVVQAGAQAEVEGHLPQADDRQHDSQEAVVVLAEQVAEELGQHAAGERDQDQYEQHDGDVLVQRLAAVGGDCGRLGF